MQNSPRPKANDRRNWEEQAQNIVEYYQSRVAEQGDRWRLGLFMAKYWLDLLSQPQHDLAQAQDFAAVLNAERMNQGSGWHDLRYRVQQWVAEVESEPSR